MLLVEIFSSVEEERVVNHVVISLIETFSVVEEEGDMVNAVISLVEMLCAVDEGSDVVDLVLPVMEISCGTWVVNVDTKFVGQGVDEKHCVAVMYEVYVFMSFILDGLEEEINEV